MNDREPPSDGSDVATEPEEKWCEKKDGYGDEIEKAMETSVQKIHELIIARAGPRARRTVTQAGARWSAARRRRSQHGHKGQRARRP
jgi:hypothetical protein